MSITITPDTFSTANAERLANVATDLGDVKNSPGVLPFIEGTYRVYDTLSKENAQLSTNSASAKQSLDNALGRFPDFNDAVLEQKVQILTELEKSGNAYIKSKNVYAQMTELEIKLLEKMTLILYRYSGAQSIELEELRTLYDAEHAAHAETKRSLETCNETSRHCEAALAEMRTKIGTLPGLKLVDEFTRTHAASQLGSEGGTRRNRRRRGRKSRK